MASFLFSRSNEKEMMAFSQKYVAKSAILGFFLVLLTDVYDLQNVVVSRQLCRADVNLNVVL